MESKEVLKQFSKHYVPKFTRVHPYNKNLYIFCINNLCSECLMEPICEKYGVPHIKKEVIVKYLKEYPEHGI